MKSLTDQLQKVIEENSNSENEQKKNFEELLQEMKKAGYIKSPHYTLPLADTIGKTYYSSNNKK